MDKKITNFALNPDSATLEQFNNCCKEKFVVKASLMPDAHSGYVAPIGAVLVTKDYIVPSWVGFDIGCGMTAVEIDNKEIVEKKTELFEEVKKRVPMGLGNLNDKNKITEHTKKELEKLINKFKQKPHAKEVLQLIEARALKHLGTLGHGNHFIELGISEKEKIWVVVHSGSRGIGHRLAQKYMKEVAGKTKEYEQTFPIHKDSKLGKEYLNVLEFCLEFALLNRMEIINQVILAIEKILGKKINWNVWANKNHNHAIYENGFFIHRKGATPAKKDEHGIIPGNMKDGTFLVIGKGNTDFLESSSHGAGRKMSRTKAKENISLKEFEESMKGIKGSVSKETIDEAPMAYKDIYSVMNLQKQSVEIVEHIKPIINWKGEKHKKINI